MEKYIKYNINNENHRFSLLIVEPWAEEYNIHDIKSIDIYIYYEIFGEIYKYTVDNMIIIGLWSGCFAHIYYENIKFDDKFLINKVP